MNNGVTLHLDYNINPRNKITLTDIFLYTNIGQARTIIDTRSLAATAAERFRVPGRSQKTIPQ